MGQLQSWRKKIESNLLL